MLPLQGWALGLSSSRDPDRAGQNAFYGAQQALMAQEEERQKQEAFDREQQAKTEQQENVKRWLLSKGYDPEQAAFTAGLPANILQQEVAPRESKAPSGYTWGEQGQLTAIPGGPADPKAKKDFAQYELESGGYANRMAKAEDLLTQAESTGYSPGNDPSFYGEKIPFVGDYLQSPEFKKYNQAQSDWVRAKLRKESGATIGDVEMEREIKTYFPQPGDTPEVLEQKRQARAEAFTQMRGISGQAYENRFGGGEYPSLKKSSSNAPSIGVVEDGYRFKGGDPADPNSWEKAQ